jgi:hypothetical protein
VNEINALRTITQWERGEHVSGGGGVGEEEKEYEKLVV